MRKTTETALVKSCLQLLSLCGVFAWRNNSGALKVGKRLVRFGHPGSADILGVLPGVSRAEGGWYQGRLLAVECKLPGNFLTPAQLEFRRRVHECTGVHLVVRDVADLQAWLADAGLWKAVAP